MKPNIMMEKAVKKVLKGNSEFDSMSNAALLQILSTGHANARQLALSALARRMHESDELREVVFKAIENSYNVQAVVMSTFTVSMIGAIAVLENGDAEDYKRLKQSISFMPEIQRTDLFDYLRLATDFDYEHVMKTA